MLPVIVKSEDSALSDRLREVLAHLSCRSQGAGVYWLCIPQSTLTNSGATKAHLQAQTQVQTPGQAQTTSDDCKVGQASLHGVVAWETAFLLSYPELSQFTVCLERQTAQMGRALSESVQDECMTYALVVGHGSQAVLKQKSLQVNPNAGTASSLEPVAQNSSNMAGLVGSVGSVDSSLGTGFDISAKMNAKAPEAVCSHALQANLSQAKMESVAQKSELSGDKLMVGTEPEDKSKEGVSGAGNLGSLRQEIDAIDDQLAELLARRQEIVKQAAVLKHQSGEGMVSAQRELKILEHGAALEQRFNLPSHLMQDIQRRILRQSYKEKGSGQYACAYPHGICTVVMVGGAGGMARLFAGYLKGSNYRVLSIEKGDYTVDESGQPVSSMQDSRAAAYLRQANWCIVSVPIDVTAQVIAQICPFLSAQCVLSDFTSIKAKPLEVMLEHHSGPVVGLHPMFGPDTASLVRQVIVAVAGRKMEQCQFILEQFKLYGARVVECSAVEHDQSMRVIQALRHFTTFAYGVFLEKIASHQTATDANTHTALTPAKAVTQNVASTIGATTTPHTVIPDLAAATIHNTVDIASGAGIASAAATKYAAASVLDAHTSTKSAAPNSVTLNVTTSAAAAASYKTADCANSFVTRLLQLSSPIYHLELMMVGRLFAQDPHLYCDIISASCENLKLIREYLDCALECLAVLERNDKAKFVSDFEHTRAFFGQYATRFLHESADILAKAQDNCPVEPK